MEAFNTNKSYAKKIDEFFYQKKDSEQKMFYIMIMAIIAYLVYQFVFAQTDMMRKNSYSRYTDMKNQVMQKQSYLRINSNQRLAKLRNDLKVKQVSYDNTLYKISYVDNTLSELSYLLFNDENWAKFVDNISHLAKNYGLEIKKISNKFFKPTYQKVSQVVTIDVKTKSSYTNMMKFLNKIEESKLVVDVTDMNVSQPGSKLVSSFKISVWGMDY